MNRIFATVAILCCLAGRSDAVQSGLSVGDFGAKGDGLGDETQVFQAALNKAAAKGGVVWVPAGQYRFDGSLIIPEGVTLEGEWRGPHTSQLNKGTTFFVYAGRDQENAQAFVSLKTGSCLKGVTLFYPEQKVNDIRPYPWTIQGQGQHYNVIEVTIANAYNGIDCGTFHNEGHHLRNIHMCAVNKGVLIDYTTDIGRLENVHIHNVYWWRVSQPYTLKEKEVVELENYTKQHLEGFIIGRTDWEYISNCFVIWAKVGFHFVKTERGMANALITQSGSDLGPLAVMVEQVQSHAGIAFENCQFMSGFEIGTDNTGPVKLSNCGFWGRPGAGSQMVLKGKGTVTLTATHFHKWDYDNEQKACVQSLNGSLLMTNCDFMKEGNPSPHIFLGSELKSAVLIGNRFQHGEAKIINQSRGDVQILGNVKM